MKPSIADYKYDHTLGSGPITYFSTISSANPSEDQKNRQRQLFTPGKWDTEKYVETSNYIVNNDKSSTSNAGIPLRDSCTCWCCSSAEARSTSRAVRSSMPSMP